MPHRTYPLFSVTACLHRLGLRRRGRFLLLLIDLAELDLFELALQN